VQTSPGEALPELDGLIAQMLEARGYAIDDPVVREGDDRDVLADFLAAREIARATSVHPGSPLGASSDSIAVLAALGGLEIALQVGAILAAASVHVPVVLDDGGTWAAALIAVRLAPAAAGYLIASHGGARPGYRRALAALALEPLFDLGLAQGEGTGALLALPLLDAAARVLVELGRS